VRHIEEHYNPEAELASFMYLNVTGQVETGDFNMNGFIRCEFAFVTGPEWEVIYGDRTGKSQFARESSGLGKIIWNLGFDVGFRTLSPGGWPQLVLTFIGTNSRGADVVRGYACIHIPTVPGRHERFVRAFCPVRDGFWNSVKVWLNGPECDLADRPETVAGGEGSEGKW
jgi:B9 domain-containing protein 1